MTGVPTEATSSRLHRWLVEPMPALPRLSPCPSRRIAATSPARSAAGKSRRDDGHRHLVHQADRLQRPRIEAEAAQQGRDRRLGEAAEEDGVAIRPRGGDPPLPQRSPGTAGILDDHRLAEIGRERGRDQPGDDVGRPTRREADDHGDGAGRETLGHPLGHGLAREDQAQQDQASDAEHDRPPDPVRPSASQHPPSAQRGRAIPARDAGSTSAGTSRASPAAPS